MEHHNSTKRHFFFDWTIGIKEVIIICGFFVTIAGAWYTVKSDARSTRELVDYRYEQYQKDQLESIAIRAQLIDQIKENNQEVRRDIRELREVVMGMPRGERTPRTAMLPTTPQTVQHGPAQAFNKDRR